METTFEILKEELEIVLPKIDLDETCKRITNRLTEIDITTEQIKQIKEDFEAEFVGYPYEGQWNQNGTTGKVWVTPTHVIKWFKTVLNNLK